MKNKLLSQLYESCEKWKTLVLLGAMLLIGMNAAWARTYDGTEKLYIKNIKPGSWGKHWINGDNQVLWVQFDGNSSTNTAATYISGSGTLYSDSYYELTVPSGTYTNIVIYRGASLGSSWNNTGSISLNSTANVIDGGYSEGGTGATWNTFLEVTTSTVLYFKLGSWWYNSGCNHYIEFYTIDGSTTTLPAYNLRAYKSNNATTSTASATTNDTIFVTLSTGVYKSYKLDRKKSDSSDADQYNQSGECTFVSSTGKNQVGTMSSGGTMNTWAIYKPSSAGSVTPSSSSVSLNTAVTMTPLLTSNTLLNNLKSTAYGVSPGTSGTDWTMVGNVFTPLKAGTYTITATITYNAKGFPDLTSTVAPTTTVTAYATITFNNHGADSGKEGTTSVNAVKGSNTSAITPPQKTGYVFQGYYTGENGAGTQIIDNTGAWLANKSGYTDNSSPCKYNATTNSTLHAYWTGAATKYTITYGVGTGYSLLGTLSARNTTDSEDISSGDKVLAAKAITFTATPSQTYYEVEGFYSDAACTSSLQSGNSTTYTIASLGDDANVYVKFGLKNYAITYNNMEGATNHVSNVATYHYTTPTITLGAPTKTGYDFDGWFMDDGVWENEVTSIPQYSTGDKVLYAKWTAHTYTVEFDANGGSGSMSDQDFTYGSAQNLTSNAFTRSGYTFDGWNTEAEGGGTSYTNGQSVNNLTATDGAKVTLYAQWTQVHRAYFVNTDNWSTIDAYAWSSGGKNANWPGEGMTSTGKTYDGDAIYYVDLAEQYANIIFNNGSGTKTGDLTFGSTNDWKMFIWTGNWNTLAYDVTLDPQSGSGGTSSIIAECGSAMPGGKTAPTRYGYDFGGYYTGTDGSGTQYYTATMTSANTWPIDGSGPTTLYAKWTQVDTWALYKDGSKVVDFACAGGTYTSGAVDIEAAYCVSGQGGTQTKTLYYYFNNTQQKVTGNYSLLTGEGDPTVELSNGSTMYWQDAPGKYNITIKQVSSVWKIKADRCYTVTFNMKGHGSAIDAQDVISGGKAVAPDEPTASGYYFAGWYTDSECTSKYNFNTSVTANRTLYAKWIEEVNSGWYLIGNDFDDVWETSCTTHPFNRVYRGQSGVYYRVETLSGTKRYFRLHNGSNIFGHSSSKIQVEKNGDPQNYTSSTYDDYWYDGITGKVWFVINTNNNTIKIQDPDDASYYVVTFGYGTGGSSVSAVDGESTPLTSDVAYAEGTAITFTQTPADGYDFKEWNTAVDGSGDKLGENAAGYTIADLDEDVTVYAIYTAHTYTGGVLDKKEGDGENGLYSVTYYTTSFASKTAPTRTGYNVEGYYVETERTNKVANADGSLNANKTYTDGSSRWTYTSSIPTLYAQWQANTHDVTLDMNGSYTSSGTATSTYDATSLSSITPPQRTGYHVEGYYTTAGCATKVADPEGALVASIDGYTGAGGIWTKDADATLYANWAPTSYTVTFNDQEATTHGTASTSATYDAAMPAITVPRKDGYIFGGYYTSTGGAGTKYYNDDGSSARTWNIASETVLYAKWTGINYHVSFSANGGEGSMSDEDFVYGTSKALTTNTFTRSGYYFLGWNTNADGSGTAYHDGKSVSTMTIVPGETVILYAQWAKTQTLYFLNLGTGSWTQGASAGETTRYAYAYISYDGYVMYPLGTWTNNGPQGAAMTASASISIPNVTGSGGGTWCWSIANVPEGATIIFSDNNESHKTGDLSGWTAAKPYYCFGNDTWYALDGENTISKMTNWSVHIGKGHFGDSWKYYGLDKYDDGEYAKIWLNTDQTYQYKYSNWFSGGGGESGSPDDNAYIINGSDTKADFGGTWTLNGDKDVLVKTNSHASGEYKFSYEGLSGGSPQTKVCVPRGVNLTTTTPTEAKVGESVTVSFTADAWEDPKSGNDMDNPTYYFEYSTDNNNWTTVATYSAVSAMKGTASYTFTAQTCYFRVKLVNDHGLASYSGSTKFTAYTTKSFYLYNPWYDENWSTLHLQAWDSNDGDKNYNGSFPGHDSESCEHGNSIVVKGNGWYYITIDERANKFLFAGNETYNDHKTEDCTVANYIQDAKYMIKTINSVNKVIAYEATGNKDYRLKYTYGSPTKTLYSPIYNTDLDGTTITTSMWLDASQTSTLVVERGNGADSWESTAASYAIGTSGGGLIGSDYQDYGYVFTMTLNTTTPSISNVAVYNGPYYVRTDGLEGGWNVYKTAKHLMYYSEHSLNGTPAYDHYLCKWIGTAETNVKFTVANEYNPELVASLAEDPNDGDPLYGRQDIPTPTNVRFAWNSQTNTLTRAYLSAATDASSRFLVMVETTASLNKISDADGRPLTDAGGGRVSGLNEHELLFEDKGNWVYQLGIQAIPGAKAKVTAKYNGEEPEFIPSAELIGGEDGPQYSYRIVYDFKTNELTSAWVADGATINTSIDLNTNVMIIRKGQEAAKQITFGDGKQLTNAKKVIGVMEFKYSDMVGRMSSWNTTAYQYCMYYISFPFDVKVNDIFGIGEMGTDWRLQKYNGEKRSQIGWFAETSTFWEDVKAGETLKAYEGYSLLLNRVNFNNGSSGVWTNISSTGSVYLYFPSEETSVGTIKVNDNQEVEVPSHVCNIERWFTQDLDGEGNPKDGARNHKITDSNWNMLGTALFQNKTGSTVTSNTIHEGTGYERTLQFIYTWNSSDNTLSVDDLDETYTFKAMHAYLVQFAGKVTFSGASITPKLSARRIGEEKKYRIKLELNKGEKFAGRAYVELRENAVDSFLLNEDMYMLKNSKTADVYTYAGRYDVAANVLTVGNHVVPVGVNVKSAGEYTFSMPSNFSGEVTLIDTYTNTHTNLALEDYTVYLSKGEITDRFLLDINISKMPTAIDGVEGGSLKDGKAHKFIENGQMYILQNGVIYDAQGKRVK